jgi:nucleotide-binding universal stress UspA family protein
VISTHGYTGLKHALLGSTAETIVRHAPCPVLVVRPQEHEFLKG